VWRSATQGFPCQNVLLISDVVPNVSRRPIQINIRVRDFVVILMPPTSRPRTCNRPRSSRGRGTDASIASSSASSILGSSPLSEQHRPESHRAARSGLSKPSSVRAPWPVPCTSLEPQSGQQHGHLDSRSRRRA
jgi:hypothetical protein